MNRKYIIGIGLIAGGLWLYRKQRKRFAEYEASLNESQEMSGFLGLQNILSPSGKKKFCCCRTAVGEPCKLISTEPMSSGKCDRMCEQQLNQK